MGEGKTKSALSGVASQLPVDRLKKEALGFGGALVQQGFAKTGSGVESLTGKLNDYAQGNAAPKIAKNMAEGDSPAKAGVKATASKLKDKVKETLGGIGGGSNKLKVTNILESVDVPVPREVAYAQWTQFEDFPTFTKKVENVKQEEDQKVTWKAQIFWSHRSWDAEIVDQVPNERIVWKSDGEKGHVDGAITFHELAPDLTRINMVLEYHPKGLFEHTGNIWRAQGRRARLELKHFARHVSTHTLLHQDELEGWQGEIHDGQVAEGESDSEGDEESQDQGPEANEASDDQADEGQGSDDESDEDQADGDQADEDQADEEPPAASQKQNGSSNGASKSSEKKGPAKEPSPQGSGA